MFDVSTPLAALEASGAGQTAIWTDLGTGTSYGSRVFSAADNNTTTTTTLNASAVGVINSALGASFAVGGAVTTIDAAGGNQFVYGSSGSLTRQLVLTVASDSDYYSFSLAAGDRATIGLNQLSGSGAAFVIQDAPAMFWPPAVADRQLRPGRDQFHRRSGNLLCCRQQQCVCHLQPLSNSQCRVRCRTERQLCHRTADRWKCRGARRNRFRGSSFGVGYCGRKFDASFAFNIGTGHSQRYQQVYSAGEFSQPQTITALHFRRNGSLAAFADATIDAKINLGYAATAPGALSTTFANNVGPGTTTVVDNPALLLHTAAANSSPSSLDITIPLTTPFTYDPKLGDLLLDMFVRNGATTALFDGPSNQQQVTSSVVGSSTDLTSVNNATGGSSSFGFVTQFDTTAPREDWYALNLTAASPNLLLSTSTPADAPTSSSTRSIRTSSFTIRWARWWLPGFPCSTAATNRSHFTLRE